jgi:TorA maturation chaperone TorD
MLMNATSAADMIERLLARSACYQALSVLWRHPDGGTVKWLAKRHHERLPEIIGSLHGEESPHLRKACRRLATALGAASVMAWTREYERLFGHSVQSAAPPYELEYGEAHSHRQPQELGDIAAFYQAFGLRIATAAHERVDHIATECEFLQYLLYKQACAADDEAEERVCVCEEATRQFLTDHLGCWGPAFALRLLRLTGEGVVGAIAAVTLEWLVQDCARMQVSAGPRDLPLRLPNERDEAGCAACALQPPRSGDAAAD